MSRQLQQEPGGPSAAAEHEKKEGGGGEREENAVFQLRKPKKQMCLFCFQQRYSQENGALGSARSHSPGVCSKEGETLQVSKLPLPEV